ncbi:MAG: hypothetical protein J6X44_09800, partial [Thermoguttaceae bacterium]|nr:hypothetical protein [Thermoguttaceae bacterium]
MTYIKNISDKKATRQLIFLLVLFAFFAVPAFIVAADDDEEELYVSSYSSKKSRRGGYGITQYQARDEAADYQNSLFSTRKEIEDEVDYDAEYDQDEEFDRDLAGYASRRRYSSKNSRPPSARELEEKYGFSTKSSVDGLVVGSDAFLDAATADVYARNAEQVDAVEATSGLGSKRKSKKSKDLFGFAVETNARDGDTFKERWIEPDAPKELWRSQLL